MGLLQSFSECLTELGVTLSKVIIEPDMVAGTSNPSLQEAEVEGLLWIPGEPGLQYKTLSLKK